MTRREMLEFLRDAYEELREHVRRHRRPTARGAAVRRLINDCHEELDFDYAWLSENRDEGDDE